MDPPKTPLTNRFYHYVNQAQAGHADEGYVRELKRFALESGNPSKFLRIQLNNAHVAPVAPNASAPEHALVAPSQHMAPALEMPKHQDPAATLKRAMPVNSPSGNPDFTGSPAKQVKKE